MYWRGFSQLIKVSLSCLVLCLVNRYACASSQQELQSLLEAHLLLKGSSAGSFIESLRSKVADRTQRFITDPGNKDLLKTPKGVELLKHHAHLSNYFTIKRKFDDCVEGPLNERKLQTRILAAAWSSDELNPPCDSGLLRFDTLEKFYQNVLQAMEHQLRPSFQDMVYLQSVKNAVKTYLNLRYRYEEDFFDKGTFLESDEKALRKIIRDLCKQTNCTREVKSRLRPWISGEIETLRRTVGKVTLNQASSDINTRLERINKKLEAIPLKTKGGYLKLPIWDTSDADFNDRISQNKYQDYLDTYLLEASYGNGLLLMTDHIRDKTGNLRRQEDSDLNEKTRYFATTEFTYKKHGKISKKDVLKAKKEAQSTIVEQISLLNEMARKKSMQMTGRWSKDTQQFDSSRRKGINKLVRSNPVAVGQALIQNPQYSGIVCEAINSIGKEDINSAQWDKTFLWGGLIIGGTLTLTGIGAGIGATILAGTGSAAALGTVATASAVSGIALGVGEIGHWGKRSYDHYLAQQEFERSFLAGNSDTHSIKEIRESLAKFKEARLWAALSMGLIFSRGAGLKFLTKYGEKTVAAAGRINMKIGPDQLNNVSKLYGLINKMNLAEKFAAVTQLMGKTQAQKLDNFLVYLAQSSERLRMTLLNRLRTGQLSLERLKRIITKTLSATQKGCK